MRSLTRYLALLNGCLAIFVGGIGADMAPAAEALRPRLLVLTDIGGDPDDTQSLVRLLVTSNEFEIVGLVASASGTPGELKESVTRPDLIRGLVDAYGQVRDNLAKHAEGFPAADDLRKVIKSGNPQRGKSAVGEGHDTEGSRWIIEVVDRDDPRPVNITIWGGQTDLAQALYRVKQRRGEQGYQKFVERIRVYDINDQDRIHAWMWERFPMSFYVLAEAPQGRDKREGAYRGMYLDGETDLTSRGWLDRNVRKDHGPLGALYPNKTWTAPNPHSALKEGDTPSWFFFLSSGLSDAAYPGWGGWGGRFARNEEGVYRDAADQLKGKPSARWTVARWRPAFQNEFAARMDWCVKPPREANHPPQAVCNGQQGRSVLQVSARPGEVVSLTAEQSSDPDGDALSYTWWIYREAGQVHQDVRLKNASTQTAKLRIPAGLGPQEIHVILEVRDDGEPRLTSYRRAIVKVPAE